MGSRSRRDNSVRNLTAVISWAEKNFLEDFQALPPASQLTFEPRTLTKHLEIPSRNKFRRLPDSAAAHLLRIGNYDKSPTHAEDAPQAYACIGFEIDGAQETDLKVYYLYESETGNYMDISSQIQHVHWMEPFSLVSDGSSSGDRQRVKALIVYYFLAAGHLYETQHYKNFIKDFKAACAWVGNEGNKPPSKPRKPSKAVEAPDDEQAWASPNDETLQRQEAPADLSRILVTANTADKATNTEHYLPSLKRGITGIDDAYDILDTNNKRPKLEIEEIEELRLQKKELENTKKSLEEENAKLRRDVEMERECGRTLKEGLFNKENARAAAERKAADAEKRADAAERNVRRLRYERSMANPMQSQRTPWMDSSRVTYGNESRQE